MNPRKPGLIRGAYCPVAASRTIEQTASLVLGLFESNIPRNPPTIDSFMNRNGKVNIKFRSPFYWGLLVLEEGYFLQVFL